MLPDRVMLHRGARWMTAAVIAFAWLVPASAAEPPNIVVVLFDDLGYGQPSSYRGESEFAMPHLDRLVTQGIRFTDAHSAAAVCTPTRYGLLTGRYPCRIGQYGVLTTFSEPIIAHERLTIASLLKREGYATACIGKWHLGMNWPSLAQRDESMVPIGTRHTGGPTAVGFDTFYGFTHARNIETIIEQDAVVAHVKPVENQPLMVDKAVAWIDAQAKVGKPLFLYFPMCPPHTPIEPSAEFTTKSGVTGKEAAYGDWMFQGDAMLGRILEALDRNHLADNTLVVVTSDNGAAGRAYPPLRGSKSSIFEGGHRVPFVARWPGHVKPGTICDAAICLNDLLATAADVVGTRLPENAGEDSVSLVPLLRGERIEPGRAVIHQSASGDLAIRDGRWKLVVQPGRGHELYDLQDDLSEAENVAAGHPDVVARLTALLENQIATGRSTPGPAQKNDVAVSLHTTRRKKAKRP